MSQALFFAARAFVAATVAAVFILGIACDLGTSGASEEPGPDTVRGAILRVESLSLTELGALEIRDDAGKVWTFEARGKRFALFTPSHLNEHQILGLKVAVHYHREADSLIIDDITD